MTRYLVFKWDTDKALGGADDFERAFDALDEAMEIVRAACESDDALEAYILDLVQLTVYEPYWDRDQRCYDFDRWVERSFEDWLVRP